MAKFMLVVHGTPLNWNKLSADETQNIMEKYFAFVANLRKEGRYVSGSGLKGKGMDVIPQKDGSVIVDGPFTESKEVLTGYFVIEANDMKHATETAKLCPALTHDESVFVFELDEH